LFLLILATSPAFAQMAGARLLCRVETDDHALEFATVELSELRIGSTTDSLGRAFFEQVPPGTYEVVASFVGYFSQKKTIQLSPGQSLELRFHLTAQTLQEVVVTGALREMSRSDS
ncbi:MAG TPA: carboxypeptidase-like regulatory domain-containing protein, partial [Saprospiraceae bacterium]|nr:carboxypeptidase-like regulatory domain-containing protein [Saprospiraceae bacterium]